MAATKQVVKNMVFVKIISLCVLLFAIRESESVCTHHRVCNAPRDAIQYSDTAVPLLERVTNNFRSWTIEPTNSVGNVLLAFKNFNTPDYGIVEVRATKYDGSVETMVYSGNRGNFEMIMTDTWQIVVNVTLGIQNSNFTMFYYAGCEIVTQSIIQNVREEESSRKCLIVLPNIEGFINRIYMTLRRVNLPESMQLVVQDVHTSKIVANAEGEEYFETIAIESAIIAGGINSFFILIDFKCNNEECDYDAKEYIISYYAMREKDIACIEATKRCNNQENNGNPSCYVRCPALTEMVEQEYTLERLSTSTEAEISTGVMERNYRKTVNRRDRACPFFDQSRCHCTRNATLDINFCPSNVYCFEEGNCTWRCIVMKMTKCMKIQLLKIIKFF